MFKPTFLKVLLFLFVKYMVFYVFLMVKNNDYRLLEVDNLKGGHTLSYFLLIMLPYPLINMLLFSAPIYFSFKVKNIIPFVLIIASFVVAEYFVYVFFTSEKNVDMNGVYNGIISLLFFFLFFLKPIRAILR